MADTETTLLMFGKIRTHKGLSLLLDARRALTRRDYNLLIAGSPGKDGLPSDLAAEIAADSAITCLLRHLQDREIDTIFGAADAIILPYENILNSGTAILALSLGKPIIAPALGSLPELQAQIGADWVHLYPAPLTAEKLDHAISWLKARGSGQSAPDLTPLSAEVIARDTCLFYQSLKNRERSQQA